MNIPDLLIQVIGADLTKEESRQMKHIGVMLFWRIAFLGFIVFAMGWLGFAGIAGFARANELDQKLAPVIDKVNRTAILVDGQGKVSKELALQLLSSQIVSAQAKACRTRGDGHTAYAELTRDLQLRYYQLAQQSYPPPSCADL